MPDARIDAPTDPQPQTDPADPMLQKIVDALEQIRSEEFDYDILQAASEVTGEDMLATWRPSLSYLPPERRGDEYWVTVYAKGACESCPVKPQHLGTIEPKLQALVGSDKIHVEDYYDMWDFGARIQYGD